MSFAHGKPFCAGETLLDTPDTTICASAQSIASAVLSAAQAAPIHADVRRVLGQTVQGSGTESNPWGP